jgi:type IV secretion system protein VirB10
MSEQRLGREGVIMEQPIQDKAKKPAGLVPKNLQAFLLVGLALLMVVIMALTGHKPPAPAGPGTNPALPTIVPVNADRVTDFQKGIEQSQRDSAPQAEAALLALQKQLSAQAGMGQSSRSNRYGTPITSANPNGAYPSDAYASANLQSPDGEPLVDAIQEERKKRAYLSLFSDNVALSYRKELRGQESPRAASPLTAHSTAVGTQPDALTQEQLLAQANADFARESEMFSQAQKAGAASEKQEAAESSKPKANTLQPDTNSPSSINGKKYVLFEGTILEALLINRLDGSFSGPVGCLLSTNVYSHDRQHILIPSGSKILGETKKVDTSGQARLAVVFHRLIMPDGFSVNLDQFQGLDQEGATALKDRVNNHYVRIFGTSLALGVLGGVAQLGTASTLNTSATDRIREGFGTGMASAGEHILDKFLNVLPTVTIREGSRIKIYLSNDLVLPDYAAHNAASDI